MAAKSRSLVFTRSPVSSSIAVPTVTLSNGVELPVLGFGVFQIPAEQTEQVVADALAAGYRALDTAAAYRNEEAVGRAIAASSVPRDELFVTTKLWIQDAGEDNAKRAFELSLARLGLDYLDLYLIHQPFGDYYGSWRAMQQLHRDGLIRAIGVSNFYPDRLVDLIDHNEVTPAVNQVECHPFFQRTADQELMRDRGVQIESWGPFAEGRNNLFTEPTLSEIGAAHGKSVAQVVLRWLTQRNVVVIPKSVRPERMRENLDVFDFQLTDDELARIAALDTARRSSSTTATQQSSARSERGGSTDAFGQPRSGWKSAAAVGQRRHAEGRAMAGEDGLHGRLQGPVSGPRRVGKLNVEGDGQGDLAGHGGVQRAVFVYQIESYRYWERELGRSDFVYGEFGENFTVEGLADDEVCVGDRYQIGTATFEVTQPRVTCYRVGIRMNDPRIPALLVAHRRPGFYFRVLEEGDVQAGDDIIPLASGPEQMPVAEVDALLYLPGHPRQQLLRALRIPALSPGWQASFRALLEEEPGSGNAGLALTSPPPAWSGFRPLTVTAITRESEAVISIRLEDPDSAPLPAARPGQYLTLRVQPDKQRRSVLRNYSLSGPPEAGYYRITVKRERRGVASGYLHTRLNVGDQLDIAAPRGTFILGRTDAPVLLISAGIGATPVLAMLHALAETHSDREIWWLHSARNNREHSFAAEARGLIASLPNARAHVYYSRPGPDDVRGRDFDAAGRLTGSQLAQLEPPRDAEAYLCGPAPFMNEISAGLAAVGVDASRIRTEPFGPAPGLTPGIAVAPARAPHAPAGKPGDGPMIEFARSNVAVPWGSDYGSLLELAEACDVPVRWSCRTGVCHTCETTLIAGDVGYDPEPVESPAEGSALICCSQPRDDLVLDL